MHVCLCLIWNIAFNRLSKGLKARHTAVRGKKRKEKAAAAATMKACQFELLHTKARVNYPDATFLKELPILWLCCSGKLWLPQESQTLSIHTLFLSYFKSRILRSPRRGKYLLKININLNIWHLPVFLEQFQTCPLKEDFQLRRQKFI